ncbi:MAG TPA: RNA polymerase sigma factor, partial [Polyangiaceae bacterium]
SIMVQRARQVAAEAPNVACDHPETAAMELPALYTRHFDLVWRNLRRLGVGEASLDDAVQDVFLVVHRRAAEFRGQSSDKTWIIGIVLRVAHDYRRSERRHAARIARYAERATITTEPPCPAEQVELREAAALVRSILDDFDPEERSVFVLIELEEMSLREAAEAMQLSLSTCQRRLAAARRAFDRALRRRNELPAKRVKS